MGNRRPRTRTLKQGEPVPLFAPGCRTITSHGYVELHWTVAPYENVRLYEHRALMGNPLGEVHHKNGIKTDNRIENLEVLSRHQHRLAHARWDVAEGISMRERGLSYRDIARRVGIDSATVMRTIKSANGIKRIRRR